MCNRCGYDSPDNRIYLDPLTNEYYLDIETSEWDEYDDEFVHQKESDHRHESRELRP